MNNLGIPELIILMIVSVFWLVPVAAGIWALVTLHRIRKGQEDVQRRLETIERLLQKPSIS